MVKERIRDLYVACASEALSEYNSIRAGIPSELLR